MKNMGKNRNFIMDIRWKYTNTNDPPGKELLQTKWFLSVESIWNMLEYAFET